MDAYGKRHYNKRAPQPDVTMNTLVDHVDMVEKSGNAEFTWLLEQTQHFFSKSPKKAWSSFDIRFKTIKIARLTAN